MFFFWVVMGLGGLAVALGLLSAWLWPPGPNEPPWRDYGPFCGPF